jgi:hypothetical protein
VLAKMYEKRLACAADCAADSSIAVAAAAAVEAVADNAMEVPVSSAYTVDAGSPISFEGFDLQAPDGDLELLVEVIADLSEDIASLADYPSGVAAAGSDCVHNSSAGSSADMVEDTHRYLVQVAGLDARTLVEQGHEIEEKLPTQASSIVACCRWTEGKVAASSRLLP